LSQNVEFVECTPRAVQKPAELEFFAGTVKTAGNAAFVRRMKYLAFEARAFVSSFRPLEVQITRKKDGQLKFCAEFLLRRRNEALLSL
jgi:hypothetical protein